MTEGNMQSGVNEQLSGIFLTTVNLGFKLLKPPIGNLGAPILFKKIEKYR